jgi:hypothetical protein
LIELFDDSHINFKPWDDAFPMGSLIIHMVSTMDMFVKSVLNGVFTPPTEYQYQTMADIRKIVYDLTEVTQKELTSINDKQLAAEFEVLNRKCTGSYWLTNARAHARI